MDKDNRKEFNITIIRTSSIGDVVLSTSCLNLIEKIEDIVKKDIDINVFWVGSLPSMELINSFYPKIKTINIKKEGFIPTFKYLIKNKSMDVILNLQNNIRAKVLSLLLSLFFRTKITKYCRKVFLRKKLLIHSFFRSRRSQLKDNETHSTFRLFRSMSESLKKAIIKKLPQYKSQILNLDSHPNLDCSLLDTSSNIPLSKDTSVYRIVISRGGSFSPKKAPLSLLKNIFDSLYEKTKDLNSKIELIFIGAKSDIEYNNELKLELDNKFKILDFSSLLSLTETALVLYRSNILLGNDSLHFHLMEAVGKASIGIWGPTSEMFGFASWNPKSIIFSSPLGCRPCSKHGKTPCRFRDYKCFTDISYDKISSFIENDIRSYFSGLN